MTQRKTNRLVNETSPYLLQHAENPVDWYPWGDEAPTRARTENKPILLSIGYSACHWCHVMAHESFENEENAIIDPRNHPTTEGLLDVLFNNWNPNSIAAPLDPGDPSHTPIFRYSGTGI